MAHPSDASDASLTRRQAAILAFLGAVLWFLAAVLLRYLGPLGIHEGSARFILYAAIIPGTVPFVFLLQWASGIARRQVAIGASLATASALLLDGIAVAWFPGLYGAEMPLVLGASTAILWGAGVAIFLGFAISKTIGAEAA